MIGLRTEATLELSGRAG